MEINGMAHVILTASNFERSRDFYRKLLPFLGMTAVIDTDTYYYCVGGRTAPAFRFAEIDLSHAKAGRAAPCRLLAAPMAMRHDRAQSK
jgi:catechol 2,3-dioxygenase-like lactoylglutathione lyase family enzyme